MITGTPKSLVVQREKVCLVEGLVAESAVGQQRVEGPMHEIRGRGTLMAAIEDREDVGLRRGEPVALCDNFTGQRRLPYGRPRRTPSLEF